MKQAFEESESCGCHTCAKVFSKHDIKVWRRQRPVCPYCHRTTVIPQTYGISLDAKTLLEIDPCRAAEKP